MKKFRALVAVLAMGMFFTAVPVKAGVIIVKKKPPVVKVETRSKNPYRNGIWVPGRWVYRNGDFKWTRGSWVKPRKGFVYVPGHWVKRPKGYIWVSGHWKRK